MIRQRYSSQDPEEKAALIARDVESDSEEKRLQRLANYVQRKADAFQGQSIVQTIIMVIFGLLCIAAFTIAMISLFSTPNHEHDGGVIVVGTDVLVGTEGGASYSRSVEGRRSIELAAEEMPLVGTEEPTNRRAKGGNSGGGGSDPAPEPEPEPSYYLGKPNQVSFNPNPNSNTNLERKRVWWLFC